MRALAAALLLAVPALAAAPEHADPSYATWFQAQRLHGTSCCDVSDGRAVEMRYRKDGAIEAFLPKTFPHCDTPNWVSEHDRAEYARCGSWIEIPDEKILARSANPTGRAVLWWSPWYGVMCFALPPEG